jgi:hypothetical protein
MNLFEKRKLKFAIKQIIKEELSKDGNVDEGIFGKMAGAIKSALGSKKPPPSQPPPMQPAPEKSSLQLEPRSTEGKPEGGYRQPGFELGTGLSPTSEEEKFAIALETKNFSGMSLFNKDFSGKDLFNSIFTNANLAGVDFTNTNLTYAHFKGAIFNNVKFTGANLAKADLEDANLTGANFTKANLEDANLKGTNLTGANFTKANLKGANLTGANLEGATFDFIQYDKMTKFPEGFKPETFEGTKLSLLPNINYTNRS